MNKFTRFTLFAGAMAIGLAACGDDVQVVDPPPPPPPPLVVSLQPGTVAIDAGETVDLAVNVSGGDEAEAISITCNASNSAITVSAVGNNVCRVTGVTEDATATVTVVATRGTQSATAGANVTVRPDLSEPATVAIEKVTQGTLQTPVALNNVRRQVEVTVNIDPGTQVLEEVILTFRGEEIARQTLSPAQVAEIAAAIAADAPEAQALRTITFSWETDAYMIDASGGPITGSSVAIPNHLNGTGSLRAQLIVDDGTSEGDAVNSEALNLTLRNLNGFHLKIDRTGSTNTALDVQQFEWRGGIDGAGNTDAGVDGNLIPVLYTPGVTLASAQFSFAGILRSLTSGPWTYVWSPAALAAYSMPPGGTAAFPNMLRDGEYPTVVGNGVLSDGQGMGPFGGALDCTGVAIGILNVEVSTTGLCAMGTAWSPPSASLVASANQILDPLRVGERVDNVGPSGTTYQLSSRPGLPDWPQVPTTGMVGDNGAPVNSAGTWVNENIDFSGSGIYGGPGTDTGVSRVVAGFPAPTFLDPIFEAQGGAVSTAPAWEDISADPTGNSLPETVTNTVYRVRVTDADALNNQTTQNLIGNAGTVLLGSDWTDPIIEHTAPFSNPDRDAFDLLTAGAGAGGAGDDLTTIAGPSYNYFVNWTDPVNVGASGFTAFAGNPVFRQLHRVTPGGVAAVVTGSTGSTAVTPTWSTTTGITNYGRATASQQPVACDVATPANCDAMADILAGYYIYRAYVLDDAGNLSLDNNGDESIGSALIRRQAVVDPVQPTVFGITSPVNMPGGGNVTFTSNASDNLDLGQSFLSLDYPLFNTAGTGYWTTVDVLPDAQTAGGYWTPASTLAPVQGTTGGVRHAGAENEEGVIFNSPFEEVATLSTATALSRTVNGFIRSIEFVCAAGAPVGTCPAAPGDWADIAANLEGAAPAGWFHPQPNPNTSGDPIDLAYAMNRPNLASFSQYDATRFDHVPVTSGNVNPHLEQDAPDDAASPYPHRSVSTAPINPVSILLNGGVGTEESVYHREAAPAAGAAGADLHTAWAISAASASVAAGSATPAGTGPALASTGGRTVTFNITARLVTASTNATLKGVTGPGQNLFPGPLGRVDFYALEAATGTLRYLGMQNNPIVFENNPACVAGANQAEYRCWDFANSFVVQNWVSDGGVTVEDIPVLAVGVNASGDGLATFPVLIP